MTETQKSLAGRLVLIADLTGTALFAAEGGLTASAAGLDLLGVAVLAFVTALGGGILRDLLLGATPPASLRDQRYTGAVAAGAMCATMLSAWPGHDLMAGIRGDTLAVLDAAGLALFTVAGAAKALALGSTPLTAIILGTLTATGGGALRDVLIGQVPAILRVDFYATASLAGACVVVAASRAKAAALVAAIAGGTLCFALRVVGFTMNWHLPRLH